jgi:endoglycosylceramidase
MRGGVRSISGAVARWVVVTATVGACVLVAAPSSSEATGRTPAPSLAPVRSIGRWSVDQYGRVVITHGLNIIRKTAPYYPPVFGAPDARFLASQGFNGARIGFIWAGVEPRAGIIDHDAIAHLVSVNATLAHAGIRTLVDVHQDLYSEKYGGFGAPSWASNPPVCAAGGSGVPPSCGSLSAFQELWNDTPVGGRGLQTHFANMWVAGARALRRAGNLLGYDLLNEPYAGSRWSCALFAPCPAFEQHELPAFYRRLIRRVRSADHTTPIWYEPVPQTTGAATELPPHFAHDKQLGFTFHFYDRSCGLAAEPTTIEAERAQIVRCSPAEAAALDAGISYAARAGIPPELGEFGDSDNRVDNSLMVDLADERFLSWTYWQYNTTGASVAPGLLLDDAKPGSVGNARPERLDALVVPYPQAVTGTPRSYHYDRATRVMAFTYSTHLVGGKRRCSAPTTLFVPKLVYPDGYRATVDGARVLSAASSSWLQLSARPGVSRVQVQISPRRGGRTDLPKTAQDRSRAARATCR